MNDNLPLESTDCTQLSRHHHDQVLHLVESLPTVRLPIRALSLATLRSSSNMTQTILLKLGYFYSYIGGYVVRRFSVTEDSSFYCLWVTLSFARGQPLRITSQKQRSWRFTNEDSRTSLQVLRNIWQNFPTNTPLSWIMNALLIRTLSVRLCTSAKNVHNIKNQIL